MLVKAVRLGAYALIVVGAMSSVAWLWLFYYYSATRPDHAEPENGRIIVLNNHGQVSYLTNDEDHQLTLLSFGVIFLAVGAAIISDIKPSKS